MENKNNYFLKILGKASIPSELEIDRNYKITCDCSITQIARDTNEDGTYSITFKAEPLTASIELDNGKVIKGSDLRRNSVKIRNYLFKHYSDEGVIYDFDTCYDEFTNIVMSFMPMLLRETVKRLDNKK